MGARARVVRTLALVACSVGVPVLWCGSAAAKLTHPYVLTFGSFSNVQGVAVQSSSGDVYVYDGGKGTVYKFDASGSPVNFTATGTNAVSGVGYASGDEGEIAVDSSSGPAKGDIYVAHGASTVNIYSEAGTKLGELSEKPPTPWGEACGVAVDSSGNVYVGLYGNHVNKYVPSANPVTNADYSASIGGLNGVCNVAADSAGNVFADKWNEGPLTRYEPAQFGSLSATGSVVDTAGSTLAVDPANDEVYVDEKTQVSQFGPHGMPFGKPVGTFASSGSGAISGSLGIALSGFNHDVYVSNGKGGLSVFGPGVVIPTVTTGGTTNLKAASATVSGTVNPENVAVTSCTFEYGESTAYGHSESCVESPAQIGSGSQPVEVHANLSGLNSAVYHYRLVVANANGSSAGADASFSTIPPAVEEEFVTDVAGTSATLHGQLNPGGGDTTYRFEYGPTAGYGSSTPTMDAGSGMAGVPVEAHVQELLASTGYHYRLVATNPVSTVDGPDLTFTTQGIGGQLTLLDGRQWEVVSPQNKYGAEIEAQPSQGGVIQASEDGNAITYLTGSPTEAEPEGNRGPEAIQVMARRVPGGWSNRTIATRHDESSAFAVGAGSEYRMFSPNLSHSIVEPRSTVALAPGATEPTPYLRDAAACEAETSDCFTALVTPEDTQPGAKWAHYNYFFGSNVSATQVIAGSSDLSHVVIASLTALTSGAPTGGETNYGFYKESGLYEWSGGQLRFVSVQPATEGGKEVIGNVGFDSLNVRNAVSSDGSRIVWQEACGQYCVGPLYMRDTSREETVRLNPAGSGGVEFQDATADDSRVFFTASAPSQNKELYSCEIVEAAGKIACDLTGVGSEVDAVLGVSEDGTTVYFASSAALAAGAKAGNCSGGLCNLYVAHFDGTEWKPRFVAGLEAPGDSRDWEHGSNGSSVVGMTARVSPNGRFVAFMSERSLTGYDNHDAVSGQADKEVFVYDDGTQRLVCASCNPTGARPHGVVGSEGGKALVDEQGEFHGDWFAGIIPRYDNITAASGIRQPRYLSDNGQLFFNSPDALAPQDTNGLEDVYEYEPEGAGDCTSAARSYSERAYGCVGLISSGTSREESVFLEASASGNDVFFMTSARLTSQDQDTAYDVYDAHVCSSSVPCVQSPVLPPPCSSGDACKGPPSLQPSIFGSPASATFYGEGNVRVSQAGSVRPRALTRAQTLARALRVCRRAHSRNRQRLRACERRAHARYGRAARSSRRSGRGGLAWAAGQSGHNGRGR